MVLELIIAVTVVLLGFPVDIIVIGLVLAVTVGLMVEVVEVVLLENEILVLNSASLPHLLEA